MFNDVQWCQGTRNGAEEAELSSVRPFGTLRGRQNRRVSGRRPLRDVLRQEGSSKRRVQRQPLNQGDERSRCVRHISGNLELWTLVRGLSIGTARRLRAGCADCTQFRHESAKIHGIPWNKASCIRKHGNRSERPQALGKWQQARQLEKKSSEWQAIRSSLVLSKQDLGANVQENNERNK